MLLLRDDIDDARRAVGGILRRRIGHDLDMVDIGGRQRLDDVIALRRHLAVDHDGDAGVAAQRHLIVGRHRHRRQLAQQLGDDTAMGVGIVLHVIGTAVDLVDDGGRFAGDGDLC